MNIHEKKTKISLLADQLLTIRVTTLTDCENENQRIGTSRFGTRECTIIENSEACSNGDEKRKLRQKKTTFQGQRRQSRLRRTMRKRQSPRNFISEKAGRNRSVRAKLYPTQWITAIGWKT